MTTTLRIGFLYYFHDRDWMGGKNYFSSLFSAVHRVAAHDVELVLFKGHKTQTSLAQDFPFLQVVNTPLLDRHHPLWLLRQLMRLPSKRRWDPVFGRLLQQQRIHVLSHAHPLLAKNAAVKSLAWLPDFQFFRLPEQWQAQELKGVQEIYAHSCRTSDALLVSSHAARADLQSFAPWCDKPQHVLHFVSSPVDIARLPTLQTLRARYDVPAHYFHLPNQFWTHKNHQLVIEALGALKARGREVTVVCTGNTDDPRQPAHFERLMARRDALNLQSNFRVLGMVPYADMQGLMLHAHAVINPSRFEGWSTSVEEAKSMGQQLLLSDLPVHREQAPAGARYFGVDDVPALTEALMFAQDQPAGQGRHAAPQADYEKRLRDFGDAYLQIVRNL